MKALEYFEQRSTPEPNTGCWLWTKATHRVGYGQFNDACGIRGAHRGAWEATHGSIPEGMHVLHKCDVRACVNPEHLFLGTNNDNMQDKIRKGRQLRGSQLSQSKLTEHDVSIIKMLLGLDVKSHRLATLYDVSQAIISDVKLGRTWGHVAPLEFIS